MKSQILAVLATASILAASGANAQGRHAHGEEHQPQYGGVVSEVKEMQYELVARADSVAIYMDDHGKKIDTKGGSAKLTLLNGSEKTEVALVPAGENKLEAKGTFKVDKGTKAVTVVYLQGKPAQSVRFTLK